MPTTVRPPVDLQNPDVSASYAGNSFWAVGSLGNYQDGHWELINSKDGIVYGKFIVPHNLAVTPNAKAVLSFKAPATTGTVTIIFSSFRVPSGSTYDGTFNSEASLIQGVPGSANNRFDIVIPSSGNIMTTPQADDDLIIKIQRSGSSDSLATNLHLIKAVIQIDLA